MSHAQVLHTCVQLFLGEIVFVLACQHEEKLVMFVAFIITEILPFFLLLTWWLFLSFDLVALSSFFFNTIFVQAFGLKKNDSVL